jgi:hypothetical protein
LKTPAFNSAAWATGASSASAINRGNKRFMEFLLTARSRLA